MLNQKIMVFVKRIISLPILFLIGCGDVYEPELQVQPYCNMPDIDNDGVYELQLRDTWQTTHPIDFVVEVDGEPVEYADIDFRSNLYWALDDTIGYFEHQWLTDDMEYNTYGTSYVIGGNLHDLVPTTNYSSLTSSDGTTRNMIAPVKSMIGDTLILVYDVYVGTYDVDGLIDTIKISLE